jgi:hypothetical protein
MQHLDLGVQFMILSLGSGWTMWSPIPCLNKLTESHKTKKCCCVRFLSPKDVMFISHWGSSLCVRSTTSCWVGGCAINCSAGRESLRLHTIGKVEVQLSVFVEGITCASMLGWGKIGDGMVCGFLGRGPYTTSSSI